jgi:hypothetical protein
MMDLHPDSQAVDDTHLFDLKAVRYLARNKFGLGINAK